MTEPLTISEVLERAASLIEPEGKWGQRAWGTIDTCMCAEGAIYAAVGATPFSGGQQAIADEVVDFFIDLLPTKAERGNPVAIWNDAPRRTQAEVVAKLREAAALAKASPSARSSDGVVKIEGV